MAQAVGQCLFVTFFFLIPPNSPFCCYLSLHLSTVCSSIFRSSLAAADMLQACLNVYHHHKKITLPFGSATIYAARKLKIAMRQDGGLLLQLLCLLSTLNLLECLWLGVWFDVGCCVILYEADIVFCNLHCWRRMSLDSLLSPEPLSAIGNWIYYSHFLWESFDN